MDIYVTLALGVLLICLSAILWLASQTIQPDAPVCDGDHELTASQVVTMPNGSVVRETTFIYSYDNGHEVLTKREVV